MTTLTLRSPLAPGAAVFAASPIAGLSLGSSGEVTEFGARMRLGMSPMINAIDGLFILLAGLGAMGWGLPGRRDRLLGGGQ